jgi:isopentenyldiphosphate isomerase
VDERIDILDPSGEQTGRVAWKSEAHRLGLWHRCFHLWIVSPETPAAGPYLFVQRRASGKETWPDRLDVTVAGHLGAGEEKLEGGLREVEEELGLLVKPEELVPLGTCRVELKIPVGIDREFHEVFLLVRALRPEDLRLQKEEVAAVMRIRLDAAEALDEGGSIPAEEWKDGETSVAPVGLSDFVPAGDGYLPHVARAARDVLSGRRPGNLF